MSTSPRPDPIWRPSPAAYDASTLAAYQTWLAERGLGPATRDYAALWQWSTDNLETFWRSTWDFFGVLADGDPEPVLTSRAMPGAQWFPNTRLNYAEHVFRHASDARPALIARSEGEPTRIVDWQALRRDVGAFAATLRRLSVRPGDRVAAVLPSRPETVAAFLACASLGAIWSSCSPDMGLSVLADRFKQIEPTLLLAVDSYRYNGSVHHRAGVISELLAVLPSVRHVIHVPGPGNDAPGAGQWRNRMTWADAIAAEAPLRFDRLPFAHPLWIVYSSGTTGLPKPIVHSHGGIVLAHLNVLGLQHDVREGDRMLYLGGTGWIVWNILIGASLVGATAVLVDGNPAWPEPEALWRFVDEQQVTMFGCGAAYLANCMKQGLRLRDRLPLTQLRMISSTGSPLPPEVYVWAHENLKADLWLASISGGTDVAAAFVSCAAGLPVRPGEIQCRDLGVAACAFNEAGQPVIDEVGELVITQPMPSMPVFFWNDPEHRRYRDSYFEMFPGVWRHGDWIRFHDDGSCVIYGRSDSTINRFGIRMGTAEIYRVVEALPEIRDSLVIDLEFLGRTSEMLLFVVLQSGARLDDALTGRILQTIRTEASARHVPNRVLAVDDIPRTLSGKKMEVPVRRLLLGAAVEKVAHPDAMANPASLDYFVMLGRQMNAQPTTS